MILLPPMTIAVHQSPTTMRTSIHPRWSFLSSNRSILLQVREKIWSWVHRIFHNSLFQHKIEVNKKFKVWKDYINPTFIRPLFDPKILPNRIPWSRTRQIPNLTFRVHNFVQGHIPNPLWWPPNSETNHKLQEVCYPVGYIGDVFPFHHFGKPNIYILWYKHF